MAALEPGVVLDGKFSVERVIGQGGAGVVVAAHHVALRQRVALKFLRPELAADAEIAGRFLREAQAAAQLRGSHVVRVMDAGRLASGEAYIVMEYLEGQDLGARVKSGGALPLREAVDCVLQACAAIAEAHALGIVHRDLKPGNLFLTRTADGAPLVKVLDFGLSKLLTPELDGDLTQSQHVIGSPHYMSPEQMRSSRSVGEATDIWALGATLFTLLAGRVPFEGRYLVEVCAAVMSGQVPSLVALRPEVPRELEWVVRRCLRLEPAERFESVMALAEALAPFGSGAALGNEETEAMRVTGASRAARAAEVAEPSARDEARVASASSVQTPLESSLEQGTGSLRAAAMPDLASRGDSGRQARRRWAVVLGASALTLVGLGAAALRFGSTHVELDGSAPEAPRSRAAGSGREDDPSRRAAEPRAAAPSASASVAPGLAAPSATARVELRAPEPRGTTQGEPGMAGSKRSSASTAAARPASSTAVGSGRRVTASGREAPGGAPPRAPSAAPERPLNEEEWIKRLPH